MQYASFLAQSNRITIWRTYETAILRVHRLKTTIVHTVTYFIVGLIAFTFLDYSAKYADPIVANFMRQTDHPLVAAGPLFQLLRGFLFGIVFYVLREIIFPQKRGWLTLWLVLVIVGILSPFGAAPSSIEGMLYTVLPIWFHIAWDSRKFSFRQVYSPSSRITG